MKGEARDRAEWNRVVITDAIVPAYVQLMLQARTTFTASQYMRLFPSMVGDDVWRLVTLGFYQQIRHQPVLQTADGRWIQPQNALVMLRNSGGGNISGGGNSGNPGSKLSGGLHTILMGLGVPIVVVQEEGVYKAMLETGCVRNAVDPPCVRECLREKAEEIRKGSLPMTPEDMMVLLKYCTSDLDEGTDKGTGTDDCVLEGLPLIPLFNGEIGTFQRAAATGTATITTIATIATIAATTATTEATGVLPIMVTTDSVAIRLMERSLAHMLVDPMMVERHSVLRSSRVLACTQLQLFNATTSLPLLLPLIYPSKAQGKKEVIWEGKAPTLDWISTLWEYVQAHPAAVDVLVSRDRPPGTDRVCYPVVPTKQPKASTLLALRPGMSAVVVDPLKSSDASRLALDDDKLAVHCLCRVGVRCVNAEVVSFFPALERYLQHPTPLGVLEALYNTVAVSSSVNDADFATGNTTNTTNPTGNINVQLLHDRFDNVPAKEIRALRLYLMNVDWRTTNEKHRTIMLHLPIFELHGDHSNTTTTATTATTTTTTHGTKTDDDDDEPLFGALIKRNGQQRLLPPTGINSLSLFDSNFIRLRSTHEANTFKTMGIAAPNKVQFYIEHFFPNLNSFADTTTRDLQMEHVLNNLGGLMAERDGFEGKKCTPHCP